MTFHGSHHPVTVVWVKDAFPTFMRSWKLAGRVSQLFVYVGEPEEAPALYVPLVDEAVPALGDRAESMRILEQRLTQPSLAFPQCLSAQDLPPSQPSFIELAFYRRGQSIERSFRDAIVCACLHHGDCRLRVDLVGNHEERDVVSPFPQQSESGESAEVWSRIVGK